MTVDRAWASIADRISDRQVLELEQSAIRIPSSTLGEGKLADHLASYMSDAGLDVEMIEVKHPVGAPTTTRAASSVTKAGPAELSTRHPPIGGPPRVARAARMR